jgi:hypothetical protein
MHRNYEFGAFNNDSKVQNIVRKIIIKINCAALRNAQKPHAACAAFAQPV